MSAVDWILVGQRALNVVEAICLFGVGGLLFLCGIAGAAQEWRYRERARRVRVSSHPSTNVVRLHPRGRVYDWQSDESGIA